MKEPEMSGTLPQPLLPTNALQVVEQRLSRPESIQVLGPNSFAASCRGRGVSLFDGNGARRDLGPEGAMGNGHELIPNGIAPLPDGSFLLANIGEGGGVWRLSPEGELSPHLIEVDGIHLAATNFVMMDPVGRIWITVSTTSLPRFNAYSNKVANGLLIVQDETGTHILADDIAFANECRLTPDGSGLVVSETFGRRVTRFDLEGKRLVRRRTLAQFGHGDFPDGCRYDSKGHLWLTSIVSNRIWRIAPNGEAVLILADTDPAHVEWVEAALAQGRMGRDHFYDCGNTTLRNVASIAFSADGRTAWLGSLAGDTVYALNIASIVG
jgi:hypothetical protein